MSSYEEKIIPFFALGANVVPGEALALHIFEPRYKRMLKHCLRTKDVEPFGLSLISARVIQPIGCTCEVTSLLKKYDDGRSLILGWGRERYRLLEILPEIDFPRARVALLKDNESNYETNLKRKVMELYRELSDRGLGVKPITESVSECISFKLVPRINLEQSERQELLNQPSEFARLTLLKEILEFKLSTDKLSPKAVVHSYIH